MKCGLNPGAIMAIGGDPKDGLFREVVTYSGGDSSRIVVIPHANERPEEEGDEVKDDLIKLGAGEVHVIHPDHERASYRDALAAATGIYMMGGSQLRLLERLEKQGLDEEIRSAHKRGIFVAGNSAGAAVLVTRAVVGGMEKGNRYIREDNIKFARGLGLVSNMVIDTHIDFLERYMRLFGEAAISDAHLVVGLEEDTGLLMKGCLGKVLGKGSLVIVRRGPAFRTNIHGNLGRAKSANVENLLVSVFAPGTEFGLHSMCPDREI